MSFRTLVMTVLCFSWATNFLFSQANQKERVAEGQYVRMKDGQSIAGSTQSWVLWKSASGYILEDRFHLAMNPALQLLLDVGPKHMSSELKQRLQTETTPTDLTMELNAELQGEKLLIGGERVLDGKPVKLLNCEPKSDETRCTGPKGTASLPRHNAEPILYSFPFPMIFSGFVRHDEHGIKQTTSTVKVAAVNYGAAEPTDATVEAKYVVSETIRIGDRAFSANRYQIQVNAQAGWSLKVTVWASNAGLVLALETPDFPGERVELVQYRKYLAF